MKAVIISDSEGNRLRPITCSFPKGMLPVMDRPLIEHTVRLLKRHGIEKITIAADYLQEEIKRHFSSFDGGETKIEIVPMKNTEEFFKDEDVLFISASVFSDIDITELLEKHKESGAQATLVCKRSEKAYEYGGIKIQGNKITEYIPSPDFLHPTELAFSGIGVVCKNTAVKDASNLSALAKALAKNGAEVFSYVPHCYIKDVSDFDSYRAAVRDFFDKKLNLPFPCEQKAPGVWIDENATIMQGTVIVPPVFIGKDTLINRGARIEAYSQIGKSVTVECFAGIKRSTLMENSYISEGATLRGAIAARKCEIGSGSAVYEGGVIGENTKIGNNCTVKTGVHIWPDKYIEDESTVCENIIWEKTSKRSLFSEGEVLGVINKEITPEFAAMLGRACACVLGDKIAVSCDCDKFGSMIKNALIAGVSSGGATAYDFGEQPLPITRSGIRFYNLCGGIALSTFTHEGKVCGAIDIINKFGANIEKDDTEKTEKLTESSLSKRVCANEIKEPEYMFEYKLYYLKKLVNSTTKKPLGARVLIFCPSAWARELLKSAAKDLKCEFCFEKERNGEAFAKKGCGGKVRYGRNMRL